MAEGDVFMDEIDRFSDIPWPLRGRVFKSVHGDFYRLEFWNTLTERLRVGEVFDVIPCERGMRFRDRASTRWTGVNRRPRPGQPEGGWPDSLVPSREPFGRPALRR